MCSIVVLYLRGEEGRSISFSPHRVGYRWTEVLAVSLFHASPIAGLLFLLAPTRRTLARGGVVPLLIRRHRNKEFATTFAASRFGKNFKLRWQFKTTDNGYRFRRFVLLRALSQVCAQGIKLENDFLRCFERTAFDALDVRTRHAQFNREIMRAHVVCLAPCLERFAAQVAF